MLYSDWKSPQQKKPTLVCGRFLAIKNNYLEGLWHEGLIVPKTTVIIPFQKDLPQTI